ncbi:MAG: hypothetical protein AAF409_01735 [Pseudomonadota bacterium]
MMRALSSAAENTEGVVPKVDLIEDVHLAIRIFQSGTRGIGDACRLVLSLNGTEIHVLDEDAGDRAPAELVIDLRMPAAEGMRLMAALAARPWRHPDHPVIIVPGAGGTVDYLVRTPTVGRVLDTIAGELDLELEDPSQTALDVVGYRG